MLKFPENEKKKEKNQCRRSDMGTKPHSKTLFPQYITITAAIVYI